MTEIVYVFSNPCMPGYIKIGMTTRDDVRERLQELSNPSGVPVPFECPYAAEVSDATAAEKAIHEAFADYRPNPRREFFTIAENKIIALLKAFAISDKTPFVQEVLDEITSPEDKSAQAVANACRGRFNFSENDIERGAELVFDRDKTKKCTVVDDKKVMYAGEEFATLLDLTEKLLREMGVNTPRTDMRAPREFTFNGEFLCDRRVRFASGRET